MNTEMKQNLFKAQEAERKAKEAYDKALAEVGSAKDEIRNHPGIPLTVSEHALVKFMEDILGMDLQQYRTQMLNQCDHATEVDEQNRTDGFQTVYKTPGPGEKEAVFIVKQNNIVTSYANDPNSTYVKDRS